MEVDALFLLCKEWTVYNIETAVKDWLGVDEGSRVDVKVPENRGGEKDWKRNDKHLKDVKVQGFEVTVKLTNEGGHIAQEIESKLKSANINKAVEDSYEYVTSPPCLIFELIFFLCNGCAECLLLSR